MCLYLHGFVSIGNLKGRGGGLQLEGEHRRYCFYYSKLSTIMVHLNLAVFAMIYCSSIEFVY